MHKQKQKKLKNKNKNKKKPSLGWFSSAAVLRATDLSVPGKTSSFKTWNSPAAPSHRGEGKAPWRPAYSTLTPTQSEFTGFLGVWEAASSGPACSGQGPGTEDASPCTASGTQAAACQEHSVA